MSLEVTVGPPRLTINDGYSVLVTEHDGQIQWPSEKGLYCHDTRVVSAWSIFADGRPFELLNSGAITYYAARIFLTNPQLETESGSVPAHTLGLSIGRTVGPGLHEDLDLINHGRTAVGFNLEIRIRSDFADIFEAKTGALVRRGRVTTHWSALRARLEARYRNDRFRRTMTVAVRNAGSRAVYANGRISFPVRLQPGEAWHACLLYSVAGGADSSDAPTTCIGQLAHAPTAHGLQAWRAGALKMSSSDPDFDRFYRQSIDDMAALRLPIEGAAPLAFVPAAGVPWFVALLGRDSLIASLQTAMVQPLFALGALEVLGGLQAQARDDYRDAEPGKIPHELRRGELAELGRIPHTPYYGTADATILYLIVLHTAWRRTGDLGLVRRFLPVAEKCLDWIDHYGDRDGDGFQEYGTRSSAGYANQGWKDSGEALVTSDGQLVSGPVALVELQGYVYDAWRRMAEIYDALGEPDRAGELLRKAAALYERFNARFWDEASGFYAFCLDGEKRPVLSVASNPGHALWSGIVPPERAERVVRRLMQPDMWTGRGIRTLSADHPSYNPFSYQTGSIWPHDNAIIALGLRRYGFVDEALTLAHDLIEAASKFRYNQVPELYAGVARDPTNFPVQYIGANVPQAWAAGSCFVLLQIILGFDPDAPAGRLYLDPQLPPWLSHLELSELCLGDEKFDLRLRRDGSRTVLDVLKGDPSILERRPFRAAPQPRVS
jgi:glycogen debranching enzyme